MRSMNSMNVVARMGLLSLLLVMAGMNNVWAIAGVDFSSYELQDAQDAIDSGDFDDAIEMLDEILSFEPEDADALNLMGFSLRSVDRDSEAMEKYQEALAIDADHQGALEYQGELFLKMGDQAAAEANLNKLNQLCPDGCEARATLETAIEKFKDGITVGWVKPASSD